MTTIIKKHFCKVCRKQEPQSLQKTGGAWITKPFKNWKRAVEKLRAHSKSDSHIKHCEAELLAARARKEESSPLYSNYKLLESKRGRYSRPLLLCTHFLAWQQIPHTTNFDKLVDLVMSW